MRFAATTLKVFIWVTASTLMVLPAVAATYNEGGSGDLSNNQNAPTSFTLTAGANSIIGSVGGSASETQDWIAITVPAGLSMGSYVNAAYGTTGDVQGFTGFTVGSTFPGSVFSTSSYAGYAHFGTGATNSGINGNSPTTTVGIDLLTTAHYMSDNGAGGTAAGATGYTAPLGPGTYTFLIQQTSTTSTITYEFDISAVPEPTAVCLLAFGGLGLLVPVVQRIRRKV